MHSNVRDLSQYTLRVWLRSLKRGRGEIGEEQEGDDRGQLQAVAHVPAVIDAADIDLLTTQMRRVL